jgi:class 3 adenylate cyclase/tetratricopeptide (TPR) repeat protein
VACAQCGAEVTPGKKFCGSCGSPVAAQDTGRFATPDSYTPRHLAEKILTSKGALEGERKQVTVLFADLKGSMELLADRDPEEARKLLDPVLERMMEAVHHYEGTVNQVMGDGIMALFGAPVAHEDHAVRACYAALDMQAAIRRDAEEVRRSHGVVIQVRIGLNSGEVVVRAIGSDLRMDYTAIGQTTHLAARMEQLAKPDTTLLTADTLRLAEGYVEVKPLGAMPVKGLPAPVDAYELLGAGPWRTRLSAAATRGLTRFVGRDAELEQLREALGRAAEGHGQVVALVGEPGVGKSRLVWEVTHSHRVHDWLILEAGALSYGKATPYLPVGTLLRGYFRIGDRDEPRAIREKVTGKLLTLDRTLEPALPAFLALLDLPVEDPRWEGLDPPQRRQRTLDAVRRLLLRESQVQPLLVVVEDLHWIDGETQTVLESLVESLPAARLLLLVNYRPEYHHPWGGKTYYRQLRIDPLPPENADELLEALLGPDVALGPLKRLLVERTEANPLFLEESVRALAETGALAGERGAYRLIRPVAQLTIPATVQAILAARIDRLAPEAKRLLQAAAVIGKDVALPLLLAIADAPEPEVRAELTHLQAAEFLYETRLFPDLEYTFTHALTQEAAYQGLLHDRRRALHARITEALERLSPERLAEQVERLADHALRGEVWGKALGYLRQAGMKALARSAYHEAVTRLEQALGVLARLPESRETIEQAIDVRLQLRNPLWTLGEHQRVFDILDEAGTLSRALGDRRRLGWVSAHLTNYFFRCGQHDRAVESGRQALAIAQDAGDFGLQVVTTFHLGQTYRVLGEYPEAISLLRNNLQPLRGDRLLERFGLPFLPSVASRAFLVWALAERGEFTEGLTIANEAVRIAESVDLPFSVAIALLGVGFVRVRRGDFHEAIPVLERALATCRTWQIETIIPVSVAALGYAYVLVGRAAEALPLLQGAVKPPLVHLALFTTFLGEAHLRAGNREGALSVAREALTFARHRKERGHEAWALRLLGEIHAHCDPVETELAEGRYRESLALAEALSMRPLVAHCHLGLGQLYRRTANRQQAQEHLATAVKMYREMDMTFWLEKAGAEVRDRSA